MLSLPKGSGISTIGRYRLRTTETQDISPGPMLLQRETETLHNAPVLVSTIRPNTIYAGVSRFYRSTDGGRSWQALTGDVARPLPKTVSIMGLSRPRHVVFERDAIRSIAESPISVNILWFGTEHGALYVTRDGGRSWSTLSYPRTGPGEFSVIAGITASRLSLGTAYVALNNVFNGDFSPIILKTADFGKHWVRVTNGLAAGAAVWSVCEDPRNPNLLFAATDKGVYYSTISGIAWHSLQNNMPRIRVTAVLVQPQRHDLIAATWGRGLYVMNDITSFELSAQHDSATPYLFPITDTARFQRPDESWTTNDVVQTYHSANAPYGAQISYTIPGALARASGVLMVTDGGGITASVPIDARSGFHRYVWDLSASRRVGPKDTMSIPLPPGAYKARIILGDAASPWVSLRIAADPVDDAPASAYAQQYRALSDIADLDARAHNTYYAASILARSVPRENKIARRRVQSVLESFEPPTVGFDALDGLSTPPGIIHQLEDIALAMMQSSQAPTKTQLMEISRIHRELTGLEAEEASIRGEIRRTALRK